MIVAAHSRSKGWSAVAETDALERFERLVHEQAPAVPWTPVTDYSWEAREPIEAPHADRIVSTFHPVHVLDFGCGPGHLVRLLKERGVAVSGYEPQRDGPGQFYWSDAEYDLVICREVLEHVELRQYLRVVGQICSLAACYLYITTRFHPQPEHLLDVATSDELDPTHITLPNQDLLRALIVLHGFARDRDKEQSMDWQHKGRVLVYRRV
jgi:SAM-dependent methyltransferase